VHAAPPRRAPRISDLEQVAVEVGGLRDGGVGGLLDEVRALEGVGFQGQGVEVRDLRGIGGCEGEGGGLGGRRLRQSEEDLGGLRGAEMQAVWAGGRGEQEMDAERLHDGGIEGGGGGEVGDFDCGDHRDLPLKTEVRGRR